MLPKSINSVAAEVTEVISDTQLRIKKEFSGDSGSGTEQIREKVANLNAAGIDGLEFKKMPYVDQQELYDNVYECLKPNGSVGIFPEGGIFTSHPDNPCSSHLSRWKPRSNRSFTSQGRGIDYGS